MRTLKRWGNIVARPLGSFVGNQNGKYTGAMLEIQKPVVDVDVLDLKWVQTEEKCKCVSLFHFVLLGLLRRQQHVMHESWIGSVDAMRKGHCNDKWHMESEKWRKATIEKIMTGINKVEPLWWKLWKKKETNDIARDMNFETSQRYTSCSLTVILESFLVSRAFRVGDRVSEMYWWFKFGTHHNLHLGNAKMLKESV